MKINAIHVIQLIVSSAREEKLFHQLSWPVSAATPHSQINIKAVNDVYS